jgi:hypothetical protein
MKNVLALQKLTSRMDSRSGGHVYRRSAASKGCGGSRISLLLCL